MLPPTPPLTSFPSTCIHTAPRGPSPWVHGAWRAFGARTLPLAFTASDGDGDNNAGSLPLSLSVTLLPSGGDGAVMVVRTPDGGEHRVLGHAGDGDERGA